MITIDENLLGLLIAGPIAVMGLLGFLVAWLLGSEERMNNPLTPLPVLLYSVATAVALIMAFGFVAVGFGEGVS